jgi:hypothetical protein
MTLEGYNEAIPRVVPVAQALAKRGAKVISVFGSSLTFYKGAKFNEELTQQVTKATGVPATTQSNGLVDGLRTVNAKRVAVATAYTDIVTGRLKAFLEEHGFEVTSAKGLGYERIPEGAATQEILFNLGADAYAGFQKGRRARGVLRRLADARSDRSAREQNQGPRRVIDAARTDEWRQALGRETERSGIWDRVRPSARVDQSIAELRRSAARDQDRRSESNPSFGCTARTALLQ